MTEKRLRPKYLVFRIQPDGTTFNAAEGMKSTDPEDINSPFVLMPRKDPVAFAAMIAYARVCEPDLASEIKDFLHRIASAPTEFGTQGERNFVAVRLRNLHDIITG